MWFDILQGVYQRKGALISAKTATYKKPQFKAPKFFGHYEMGATGHNKDCSKMFGNRNN
jgi:hypothetical protein